MMKLPPWFPLAAMVTSLFLLVIAVWITFFILARKVNMQPYVEANDPIQTPVK